MKLFTRLFFFYFLLLACQSFAQPSNDDCNGAIRIPLSLGWSSLPGLSVRSATESFRANPQCDNSVANIARDVWFKFTPITPTVTIQVSPSVSLDPAFEVFTSCSGPSASISCIDRAGMSGFGLPEEVTLNLVTGNTYYMRVYHFTRSSIIPSTLSFEIRINSIAAPPPAIPTITATAANTDVTVRWNNVAGATSYTLYNGNNVIMNATSPYVQTNKPAGEHCYKVKACNSSGSCSEYSNEACVTIIDRSPPRIPTNLVARGTSCTEIEVTWDAVANATSYKLYNAANTSQPITTIQGSSNTSYTHTGRTLGTQYCYKIEAINAYSTTANLSQQSCGTPIIKAPVLSASVVTLSRVRLTWDAVCGATKYTVYDGAGRPVPGGQTTATNYLATNLSTNQEHCFTVIACNASGSICSAASNSACEMTTLRYIDIGNLRFTADNIVPSATDGIFTLTGTVKAGLKNIYPNNRIVKFTGTVVANTNTDEFSGNGTISIERGQRNGSDFNLMSGNFKFSVREALADLFTNTVSNLFELAGLNVRIDKFEGLADGINIEGDVKLPDIVKYFDANNSVDAHITKLQIRQNTAMTLAASIELKTLTIGYGLRLNETKIYYDGIENTLGGGTMLKTPLFKVGGFIGLKDRKVREIGIQYTNVPPIPLGTTGLSIASMGGRVENLDMLSRLSTSINGRFTPTVAGRFDGLQLVLSANYQFGSSFTAQGTGELFAKPFVGATFNVSGWNDQATNVTIDAFVEFCIMDAHVKANIANKKMTGEFGAKFKMPCGDCFTNGSWLRQLLPCNNTPFAMTKNYLQDNYLVGYAKIPIRFIDIQLFYRISRTNIAVATNYEGLFPDFANRIPINPFRPDAITEDTTWYAYNVNKATQSLIIEAFGGRNDVPKFWIRTPTKDTITAQNIQSKKYVTYFENPTTHYAAYYFNNPRNGDYFVGVINADSINVHTALVRPSIELTNVRQNITNKTFTLDWKDECPDREALISLGYAADTEGGTNAIFADSISENSPVNTYTWNYANQLRGGKYYFYATIQDSIGLFRTVYFKTPFTVAEDNAPNVPSNLTHTVIGDTIALNWNGNNAYPITYVVYYSNKPNTVNNRSTNFAVINDTSFAFVDFTPGRYYEFMVTALDTFGRESTASNTVNFVFKSPSANNIPFITTSKKRDITYLGNTYTTTIVAQDLDNDPLTYTLEEAPSGMRVNASTGQIMWQPLESANHFGFSNVTVKVRDARGGVDSLKYEIYALNTEGATAVPEFNKALYLGYDDRASVYIRDDDFGGSTTAIDSFAVQIYSTTDPVGFSTNATEIGLNANEFVTHFNFDSLSTGNGKIKISVGDTVWIAFTDASMRKRVVDFSYFTKVKADFEQIPFICSGDSFRFKNLSTGSGFKYEWDFSDSTALSEQKHPVHTFQKMYGGEPRIFNVKLKITDEDGRTSFVSKPIKIIPLPLATFGDTIEACNTITLDAGNPNGQYLWSNQATTQTIRLDSTQKVKVTITNSYGCKNVDSTDVTIWKVKTEVANITTATCEGNDGAITLTTSGGSDNYTYRWTDSLRTNAPTKNLSSGNYVITVTDNVHGCTLTQTAVVPLNNNLMVDSIVPFSLRCFGDANGTLTATASSPRTVKYAWNTRNTTNSINNLVAGSYNVSITTPGGCKTVASGVVTSPPKLIVDTVRVSVVACTPKSGIATANPIGGVSPYQYVWNGGQTSNSISNLVNGNYTLTVTDANSCKVVKNINITQVMPTLSATTSQVDVRCFGEGNGKIKIDTAIGGWGSPFTYSIDGSNYELTNSFNWLSGKNYTVHIKDNKGCEITRSVNLYEPPKMVLTTGLDKSIDLGNDIQLEALLNVNIPVVWQWTPKDGLSCTDCKNPIAMPLGTTTYIVSATDKNGCFVKDTLRVGVANKRKVFVPNIFSPNNDGKNDILVVNAGKEVKGIIKFSVFNRWGNQLFNVQNILPNDPTKGWDGTFNGQDVEVGTYIYTLEVVYINGQTEVLSGDVSIIR
jgi:gliding motility-associated-like protein